MASLRNVLFARRGSAGAFARRHQEEIFIGKSLKPELLLRDAAQKLARAQLICI